MKSKILSGTRKSDVATTHIYGHQYWWNVRKQQWEGLKENATPYQRPMTKYQWKKYFDSL